MNFRELERLGEPDLQVAGLKIWVHGRQFADATDYWDGNWLRVTAYCVYPDSAVRATGAILHLGEIYGLLRGCQRMHATLTGEAKLDCIEPNLSATLQMKWNGQIEVSLSITPDHLKEKHAFEDSLDQSYLPGIISQCESILAKVPVCDAQHLPSAA